MALSQKHRSVLFEHFAALVGGEVTEALIAEFPARENDELVTRQFLRAELAELRADLLIRLTATLLAALAVATTIIIAFG